MSYFVNWLMSPWYAENMFSFTLRAFGYRVLKAAFLLQELGN